MVVRSGRTKEKKEMSVEMKEIRAVERAWKEVFSTEKSFSGRLNRWQDEVLYDMYDHNQFVPSNEDTNAVRYKGEISEKENTEEMFVRGQISKEDLEKAFVYQKEHGFNFLKYDARKKLDSAIVNELGLEECEIYTMLLSKKDITGWKINDKVAVKDVKKEDIGSDILELEIKNYASLYGHDFTQRKMKYYLKKAKETDGFHYLAAYLDGKIVGACYAFAKHGYVVMDSLIVNEEARKQYVATTLMKYIAEQFDGKMFLHADADDTPKDMYAKMGFEIVDSLFEYCKTW